MKLKISKDTDGFLAEIEGYENIYAYGNTEEEAKTELLCVIEMMLDYHTEQVKRDTQLKEAFLKNQKIEYAV